MNRSKIAKSMGMTDEEFEKYLQKLEDEAVLEPSYNYGKGDEQPDPTIDPNDIISNLTAIEESKNYIRHFNIREQLESFFNNLGGPDADDKTDDKENIDDKNDLAQLVRNYFEAKENLERAEKLLKDSVVNNNSAYNDGYFPPGFIKYG